MNALSIIDINELSRVSKLVYFLKTQFPDGIQCFHTMNLVGDTMSEIYDEDGITVDYCYYYDYIEIFGLERDEYNEVINQVSNGRGSDYWE